MVIRTWEELKWNLRMYDYIPTVLVHVTMDNKYYVITALHLVNKPIHTTSGIYKNDTLSDGL